jgi:hypothetical protein
MTNAIGKIGQTAKIAAGLFWADYAGLKIGMHLEGVLG